VSSVRDTLAELEEDLAGIEVRTRKLALELHECCNKEPLDHASSRVAGELGPMIIALGVAGLCARAGYQLAGRYEL